MVTGNRNMLNSIKGITSVVKLTAEEKTALADRVLPANVLVVDSSNIIYLTDGVTAVKALNPLYGKDVVHLTGNETINGTKTFSAAIVGSVTGNAGSATKLATARTINGTSFNGTANITTANWGTARNISITDGTNTSTAVSVNGSANVALKLPATIKANLTGNASTATTATTAEACTGNAATATKATQDSDGNKITTTYSKVGHTHDDRYYTEAEVNNLLGGKANTSHDHNSVRTPDYHAISFDWDSQVSGFVGLTVDVTKMGGIVTTATLSAYATKTELNNGLATKANDSDVVHKSGNETIAGAKSFTSDVEFTSVTNDYITGLFAE